MIESPPAPLNPLAAQARTSGIRAIADLAARRAAEGRPVYRFHLGEPDFDTPPSIKAATVEALRAGHVHYPPNAGIPELRRALAGELAGRYGARFAPEDVVVTVGACEALTLAYLACLTPGDEVLVPTPAWPNYLQTPLLFGVGVREVPLAAADGFRVRGGVIADAIGPRTRMVVLNSPGNPTGVSIAPADLRIVLDAARARGIWVVVDEIYHDLVFEDGWRSVLEVARPDDPLVYVNGFGKSYAMTGWRLGYAAASGAVGAALQRVHQALVTSVNSFVQYGALAALQERDAVVAMRSKYRARRDRVLAAFAAAGIETPLPDGAFYAFGAVPTHDRDGDGFAHRLLERTGVAVVPGTVFGTAHRDRFRLCFACADDELDAGLEELVRFVRAEAIA
jgi:aspartate/methionine/tyrosine aminotransferase